MGTIINIYDSEDKSKSSKSKSKKKKKKSERVLLKETGITVRQARKWQEMITVRQARE